MSALVFALPSKGRLREDLDRYLADRDVGVKATGGDRGYTARLTGVDGVDVRLMSASEIVGALARGDVHLGVTGQDLIAERAAKRGRGAVELEPLGFGRADLVVAAPQSWLDVTCMADLDAVAPQIRERLGRRLRVATKYDGLVRRFFAEHGVMDYRTMESAGATEGAPAAGLADVIVDITSTGRTLKANGLKILQDGVILRSEACIAAAPSADWDAAALTAAARLFARFSARKRALETVTMRLTPPDAARIRRVAEPHNGFPLSDQTLRAPAAAMDAVARDGLEAGAISVTVQDVRYVYERDEPIFARLKAALA